MKISNYKILHIMPDDKFNDIAIRQFETVAPGIHEYRILTLNQQLIYTQKSCVKISSANQILQELHRKEITAVFFHSLHPAWYQLLENIPQDKKIFWFGWGFDYYHLLPHNLYLPRTSAYLRPSLKNKFKSGVKKGLQKFGLITTPRYEALRCVDYFSPVLDVEFQMVTRHMPHLSSARYICWNYGTAEDDLSLPGATSVTGDNILAGNSASPTNNHIELFHALKEQVNLRGRSVIVPLSYGDVTYRGIILAEGKKILGDNFVPLTEYMPKDKYIETIRSCGFFAMNHMRQQAVGNVCIAMLMGAKIYLNDNSPLYQWLNYRGAHISTLEKLDMKPLSYSQQESNRQIVYDHWGREAQVEKTRNVVEVALNDGILA